MWRKMYKYKNMIFQGLGRPQGNGDKTYLRLLKQITILFVQLETYQKIKNLIENKNHPVIWREQDGIL